MFKTPLLTVKAYTSSKILSINFLALLTVSRSVACREENLTLRATLCSTIKKPGGLRRRSTRRRTSNASRDLTPAAGQLATNVGIFNRDPEDQGHQNDDQGVFNQPLTILLN